MRRFEGRVEAYVPSMGATGMNLAAAALSWSLESVDFAQAQLARVSS